MRSAAFFLLLLCCALANVDARAEGPGQGTVLLIVVDGLRPDYITPGQMPNLRALGESGVWFEVHHSTFPTVTRVNASSIVTGAYPERHGIMENSVYFPEVDPDRSLSTGSRATLERIDLATGGKLLLVPDIAQVLRDAGKSVFVGSAGSSGSAFLLNHTVAGGLVVNNDFVLPAEREQEVLDKIGPAPEEAAPNAARNARAVDAYFAFALPAPPSLSILWLSDPDHTAHEKGIGDPVTVASLQAVDGQIGRIIAELEKRGLAGSTNVLVTSDHGFATYAGDEDLKALMKRLMIEEGRDPADAIVAGQCVYLKGETETLLQRLVPKLQMTPWVGPIFMRGDDPAAPGGLLPGTLSLAVARMDQARAPHLVVTPRWDDAPNAHGWPGTTYAPGVGSHGSVGRWEVHNTLLAAGPAFKHGVTSGAPSHNVDLAPTICTLLDVAPAETMQGRVLSESFADGPDPASIPVERGGRKISTTLPDDTNYTVSAHESTVDGHRYLDYATVEKGNHVQRSGGK